METPAILTAGCFGEAVKQVKRYYLTGLDNKRGWTGSRFDDFGGGGDNQDTANRITAEDLVAVSFLSVHVRGRAAIGLLETYRGEISGLLSEIPANAELGKLTAEEFNELLGPDSAATGLWHLVRGNRYGRWGIGPTTASKILARKRPHLIPIWDSVVARVTGVKASDNKWQQWHGLLASGDGLPDRLAEIRKEAGVPSRISLLRIMDVALWMDGTQGGRNVPAETVDDDAAA